PQVSQVGTLDNGQPYSIENWVYGGVPADTFEDESMRITIWKNVVAEARKLASVYLQGEQTKHSFGFNGDSPTETWAQHCDKVIRALERDTQLGLSPKEKDKLASSLRSFDLTKYPQSLCHGDLKLDNVLVHPDTLEVIAVVDWEIARLAPSIVGELATTIEPAVLDIKKNAVPQSVAERLAILAAFGGNQEDLQRDLTIFFAADVVMNLDDYASVLAEGTRPDLATMRERLGNYLRGLQPDIDNLKRFLAAN
ncbi:MAG: phosphotransferase, partial [Bdellovibrionales bacterium]|nr:phosphotransferase [Bdellovibrionales bacterium]